MSYKKKHIVDTEFNKAFQTNLFGEIGDIKDIRLLKDVNFSEDEMFGESDAYIEDIEILKGYVIDRNDCKQFYDQSKPLLMLCAPKGMGKTTLCKLWEDELSKLDNHYTLMPKHTDISGFGNVSDFSELSNIWKKKLLLHILVKLTDGKLKESTKIISELDSIGYRSRKYNIFDFFINAITSFNDELANSYKNLIATLKTNRDSVIWLFLDEFDADFTREASSIKKMAALINAARDITIAFTNIKMRITIRPNVWVNLRSDIQLMSNFKDLVLYISWSPIEIRSILAKRVEHYLNKYTTLENINWAAINFSKNERENWLISQIFDTEKFDLGKGNRPPEIILSKLCADRPRWVIEISKAGTRAKNGRTGVIRIDDINKSFREIGVSRLQDIASEYSVYCPKINEILNAFYNAKSSYNLIDLITYVDKEITSRIDIEIVGISNKCTAKQVVNFLFELTFVEPKKLLGKHKFEFLHYKDFPDLIETEIQNENVEYDLYWVIHPAFRNCLNIGIPTNYELD